MKSTKLKKNSWHYWLAYKGNDDLKFLTTMKYTEKIDLCQYIRWVIYGIIRVTFISIALLIFGVITFVGTYDDIMWFYGAIANGHFEKLPIFGLLTLVEYSVVLLLVCMSLVIDYQQKHRIDRKPLISDDAFVKIAYRKWKDKTCSFVEFE